VDEEKGNHFHNEGYIDLSKKQVNGQDETTGEQRYAHSTLLHSILIHVA
jgi:translation initiation factor 2 alpha subunit (eIF-2alpha)